MVYLLLAWWIFPWRTVSHNQMVMSTQEFKWSVLSATPSRYPLGWWFLATSPKRPEFDPDRPSMKNCLVVDLPLWKMMEWKSVGIIIPNIWQNKQMFQTTNQKKCIILIPKAKKTFENPVRSSSLRESFPLSFWIFPPLGDKAMYKITVQQLVSRWDPEIPI